MKSRASRGTIFLTRRIPNRPEVFRLK
jgi:hypothetical protein